MPVERERMMVERESDGRENDGGREVEEVEERMMVGGRENDGEWRENGGGENDGAERE